MQDTVMKHAIVILLFLSTISCAPKNSFQSFYNQNKSEADWALAFPKYVAMLAIPDDSKEDVRHFTEGMKKVRVLLNEEDRDEMFTSFQSFAKTYDYTPYLVVKEDGNEINLFAKEEDGYIREVVLDVDSEDGAVIVALIGKMKRKTFQRALQEAARD